MGVGRGRARRLAARCGAWPGWRASWAGSTRPAAPSRSRTCGWRPHSCPAPSVSASARSCATTAQRACSTRRGKSYPDLVRQRAGDCAGAPDAVLMPRDHDEVRAVLEACAGAGVAVVPFGGGTSVVGGLEPLRNGFEALVSLDLGALDALETLDERSQVAVVGGGMRAVELEARARRARLHPRPLPAELRVRDDRRLRGDALGRPGLDGYGRIDELVVGARLAAPAGDLDLRASRRARRGPSCGGSSSAPKASSAPSRAWPCGCARRPSSRATRAGCSRASAPARRPCGAWSRAAPRPTWRGSRTRPRRGWGSG